MWQLFHILPLLIGGDIAPSDQHYKCFMLLQDIACVLCSPVIALEQIPLLRITIHDYLEMFTALYPNRPLIPSAITWSIFLVLSNGKCYCCFFITACKINNNFVNRYGPLVHLWCMRFEGKHKQFKQVAKTTSFENITKTLAKHHQQLLAYDLHCNTNFAAVTVTTGTGKITFMKTLSVSTHINESNSHHYNVVTTIANPSSLAYATSLQGQMPAVFNQELYRFAILNP